MTTTWSQVNSARRGDDRWVSRGLDVTSAYGVHWDPFDAKRVFISTTDIGLFRSEDAGGTTFEDSLWKPLLAGLVLAALLSAATQVAYRRRSGRQQTPGETPNPS